MNQQNGFFQVDTDRLEAEAQRPYDWQDKVVIGGCFATIVACTLLLLTL